MYRFRDDDHEDHFRLSHTHQTRPHHFKFEHSGMLVYDSKAIIICGNHTEPGVKLTETTKVIPPNVKKDLESADETGNRNLESAYFQNMREYGPAPNFPYEYLLEIPNDSITLRFTSKFESGNLYKAIKLSDYEYSLFIHNDIGSFSQNHWYYFCATNPRKTSITFRILNMRKKDTLYQSGMLPAVYSKKSYHETGIKWQREAYNIQYTENSIASGSGFIGRQKYYTLSFTYQYKYENDEVYFAYSIPYTYSDLTNYLEKLSQNHPDIVEVTPLCRTIANNICYKVVITDSVSRYNMNEKKIKKRKSANKPKKAVVLMARVHPGETVSSFMMKGAIDYLTSLEARNLIKNYVFYIVPMLNPDGVRYGNYRTSLLGVDLNRRWKYPHRVLHPTIFYSKKMIEEVKNRHQIVMVCDMHGHTKKKNVFMYGCSIKSPELVDKEKNLLARVIPYHMSKSSKFFSFTDSHFRIEKNKESTARVVLFQEFEIVHSYTMEASFFGPESSSSFGSHFSGDMHFYEVHLEGLGAELCRCAQFFNSQVTYSKKVRQTNTYLKKELLKQPDASDELDLALDNEDIGMIIKEQVCQDLEVVDVGVDPESSGSDSEPSDGEENNCQVKKQKVKSNPPALVKVEVSLPSRTPTASIKPINIRKPQVLEQDWATKKAVKSPVISIKPQETLAPQNFNFPLQSRFNPFAIEVKLRSEIPELDAAKKIPKISKSPAKKIETAPKVKNSELYLPALLNFNLPDIQTFVAGSGRKTRERSANSYPRQIYSIGGGSLNDNIFN